MSSSSDQDRLSVVRRYFRLADEGRREVLELFHENAEFYFPKFGFASGRQSLFDIVKGFEGVLEFLQHDYDGGAAYIVLGHLSESNNVPELARLSAEQAIGNRMSLLGNRILLAGQLAPLESISL